MQLLDSAIDGALGLEKEADQKDAAWALLTYMRTGELPGDLRQNAAAIMAAVLPALDMSRARAEAPKKRGKAKAKPESNDEQGESKTRRGSETKQGTKPETKAEQNDEQTQNKTGNKTETNGETNMGTNAKRRGRGIEDTYVSSSPYIPPDEFSQAEADGDYAFAEFAKSCIDAFNAETGQSFRAVGGALWTDLRRIYDSGRTVEDVRAVTRKKLAQWGGDPKMAKYVRPSTLFGRKFEEYLNEQEVSHGKDLGEYASAF